MEYLIGLVSGLVFLSCLAMSFYYGYKLGRKNKPAAMEVDEQDQRKAVELHEHFQALMNYDVPTALQRKKVI